MEEDSDSEVDYFAATEEAACRAAKKIWISSLMHEHWDESCEEVRLGMLNWIMWKAYDSVVDGIEYDSEEKSHDILTWLPVPPGISQSTVYRVFRMCAHGPRSSRFRMLRSGSKSDQRIPTLEVKPDNNTAIEVKFVPGTLKSEVVPYESIFYNCVSLFQYERRACLAVNSPIQTTLICCADWLLWADAAKEVAKANVKEWKNADSDAIIRDFNEMWLKQRFDKNEMAVCYYKNAVRKYEKASNFVLHYMKINSHSNDIVSPFQISLKCMYGRDDSVEFKAD
jgi:hypothetical protein